MYWAFKMIVTGMTLNDSMNQHIELVLQMEQHPQFDNNSFATTQQVIVDNILHNNNNYIFD